MAKITEQQAGANVPAFLDLIAHSEGTSTEKLTRNDGYDVIVTGVNGPEIFTSYVNHPFAARAPKLIRVDPLLTSTASGRYQLLYRYWPVYRVQLGLPDFGPLSQDLVAIQQIKERKAFGQILLGNIEAAISLCSPIWASLPGNDYGQGGKTVAELMELWGTLVQA